MGYTDWFNGIGGNNWDVNYMTTNATGCTGELSADNSTFVFTNCNTTTWEDADNIYIFAPGSTTDVDIGIQQYVTNFDTSNKLASGSTVQTGDLACLELDVTNAAGVDIQYLKVTTRAPGSSDSLVILENGCQTTEAAGYGITVDTSYGDGKMCFTMHRPSGSFALEVDMEVNVCVGTCATVTCTTRRRRRRAVEGETRLESGLETVFKIDPNDQCSRK